MLSSASIATPNDNTTQANSPVFRVPTPRLLVIKEDVRWKKYAPAAESMASALYMVMLLTVTPLINAIAIPVTNIGTKQTTGANSGWERILTS